MPQPVRVDHPQVGIRQNLVVEPRVPCELGVGLDRVDDDAGDRAAARAERVQAQLQALQLRDAEGSPVPTVENEEERLPPEVGESNQCAGLIRERESGRRRAVGGPMRLAHDGDDVEDRGERRRDGDGQGEEKARPETVASRRARDRAPGQHESDGDDDPVRYGVVAHMRQPCCEAEGDDEVTDDASESEHEAEQSERNRSGALVRGRLRSGHVDWR